MIPRPILTQIFAQNIYIYFYFKRYSDPYFMADYLCGIQNYFLLIFYDLNDKEEDNQK